MKDYCNPQGAGELARLIERYWAQRGHRVKVTVREGHFSTTLRGCTYALHSDMVNGLPRDAGAAHPRCDVPRTGADGRSPLQTASGGLDCPDTHDHGGHASRRTGGSRADRDGAPSPRPGRSGTEVIMAERGVEAHVQIEDLRAFHDRTPAADLRMAVARGGA